MTSATKTKNPADSGGNWFMIAIVGVVILGALGVAFAINSSDGSSTASNVPTGTDIETTSSVEVDGAPLAPFASSGAVFDPAIDPVIGTVAPTITGTNFSEEAVTIGPDGRSKVVMFLAHWCPHCQDEVPRVVDLIEEGKLPADVDVYAVSTGVAQDRGNYPPNNWLNREGWNEFSMRDSDASVAMTAFGGSGFPYVVYLDAEHRVVGRSSGELQPAQIEAAWLELAGAGVNAE